MYTLIIIVCAAYGKCEKMPIAYYQTFEQCQKALNSGFYGGATDGIKLSRELISAAYCVRTPQ